MTKKNNIDYEKVAFMTLILFLMNVAIASIGSAETNLVSYWNFNEGTGTNVHRLKIF